MREKAFGDQFTCKGFSKRHSYLAASYMSPCTITFPTNRNGSEMLLIKSNCDIAELCHNKLAAAVEAVRQHNNYYIATVTQWSCIKAKRWQL